MKKVQSPNSKFQRALSQFLTLFLLTMLFSNCQVEEDLTQNKSEHSSIDKDRISMTQFKTETNLNPAISLTLNVAKKSKNAKEAQSLPDFVMDTLAIKKYISETNKTTYSFRIYPLTTPAQPNEYYNLVYRLVDGQWKTSIFYLLKKEKIGPDHKLFEKIIRIDGSATTLSTVKSAALFECAIETTVVACNGSCRDAGFAVCDGFACEYQLCTRTTISYANCSSGGGGGGGTSDPNAGGTGGGGGGTADPYTYNPNTYDNPVFDDSKNFNAVQRSYVWGAFESEEKSFFARQENITFFNETILYQINNIWSAESAQFAFFARSFKYENPTVSWQQFQNWFMGTPEGQDSVYNPTFWEDANLTFQQQNLPSFNNFKNACPSKYITGDVLCNTIIGGGISVMYNALLAQNKKLNTCAIRISRALSYSGIVIPSLPDNGDGSKNTVKGADGLNYIINAKALNAWMKKTFGTNPTNYSHYTSIQGGIKGKNFPILLAGKKGIYSMVSLPSIQNDWGSGHADLFENGECLLNCHFFDATNNFVPIDYIDFWILD